MFHGSGGWGALQIVGKYDVLDHERHAIQQSLAGCQREHTTFSGLERTLRPGDPP